MKARVIIKNKVARFYGSHLNKNCANLPFALCLSNINLFQYKLVDMSRNKQLTKLYIKCPLVKCLFREMCTNFY